MELDDAQRRSICRSRDPRFDGWFVMAVTSTGIYCRPSCPARPAKPENLRFFPTAASAQRQGFRACKRCRPDASPGSPEWATRSDVVARAMRLIADGVVDRDGVEALASRLGYSSRHLNRLMLAELGATAASLAAAQRAQTARTLIETTGLPFTQVAFAAGFGSVRQFNEVVARVFGSSPGILRAAAVSAEGRSDPGVIRLRLPLREPYDVVAMWTFLTRRALDGVEWCDGDAYVRRLRLPHGGGVVSLRPVPGAFLAELRIDDLADLGAAVQRCRRLLDLDADPVAIDAALDDLGYRGVRVPGAVDGWELAARAIVGQQVSVASARRTLSRICAAAPGDAGFPEAAWVASLRGAELPLPTARAETLIRLARAVVDDTLDLSDGADRGATRSALLGIAGIGPWTAGYIAMRALGDPDVLLASDLVIRRQLAGRDPSRWAPWRSYATVRLWLGAAASPKADADAGPKG